MTKLYYKFIKVKVMESEKLEAFVDAVLAIILTVIVLELPQPETVTLA